MNMYVIWPTTLILGAGQTHSAPLPTFLMAGACPPPFSNSTVVLPFNVKEQAVRQAELQPEV